LILKNWFEISFNPNMDLNALKVSSKPIKPLNCLQINVCLNVCLKGRGSQARVEISRTSMVGIKSELMARLANALQIKNQTLSASYVDTMRTVFSKTNCWAKTWPMNRWWKPTTISSMICWTMRTKAKRQSFHPKKCWQRRQRSET